MSTINTTLDELEKRRIEARARARATIAPHRGRKLRSRERTRMLDEAQMPDMPAGSTAPRALTDYLERQRDLDLGTIPAATVPKFVPSKKGVGKMLVPTKRARKLARVDEFGRKVRAAGGGTIETPEGPMPVEGYLAIRDWERAKEEADRTGKVRWLPGRGGDIARWARPSMRRTEEIPGPDGKPTLVTKAQAERYRTGMTPILKAKKELSSALWAARRKLKTLEGKAARPLPGETPGKSLRAQQAVIKKLKQRLSDADARAQALAREHSGIFRPEAISPLSPGFAPANISAEQQILGAQPELAPMAGQVQVIRDIQEKVRLGMKPGQMVSDVQGHLAALQEAMRKAKEEKPEWETKMETRYGLMTKYATEREERAARREAEKPAKPTATYGELRRQLIQILPTGVELTGGRWTPYAGTDEWNDLTRRTGSELGALEHKYKQFFRQAWQYGYTPEQIDRLWRARLARNESWLGMWTNKYGQTGPPQWAMADARALAGEGAEPAESPVAPRQPTATGWPEPPPMEQRELVRPESDLETLPDASDDERQTMRTIVAEIEFGSSLNDADVAALGETLSPQTQHAFARWLKENGLLR